MSTCAYCGGTGHADGNTDRPCAGCDGTGTTPYFDDPAEPIHLSVEAERRLAFIANNVTGSWANDWLRSDDVRQAMAEILSLRTRLRNA